METRGGRRRRDPVGGEQLDMFKHKKIDINDLDLDGLRPEEVDAIFENLAESYGFNSSQEFMSAMVPNMVKEIPDAKKSLARLKRNIKDHGGGVEWGIGHDIINS